MQGNRPSVKIGNRTYHGAHFTNEHLQKLILRWQELGYSKHSGLSHQLEWSWLEATLPEELEPTYTGSSGVEYLSLPYENLVACEVLVKAAEAARSLSAGFQLPERKDGESLRLYLARSADAFELYLNENGRDEQDAAIAADYFVARAVCDPPIGYEE